MSLKDKVAIITGASSGIGAAVAILFSQRGASLVLSGRNEEGLKETISKCDFSIGNKAVFVTGDLRDTNNLKNIINECIKVFGRIDILVNNAAILKTLTGIEGMSLSDFDEVMGVNVRTVVELTQLSIPFLIYSKGCIVNVSSVSGTRPSPVQLAYNMSKSALDQFTKCISLELASKGVRVNSVNPGHVPTNMGDTCGLSKEEQRDYAVSVASKLHPIGRNGRGDEIARAIAFLASDEASFVTGELLHVDGGRQNL